METASSRLTTVETVSCLDCGTVYAKPTGRGSLSAHAGCPACGYVGWRPSTGRPAAGQLTQSPRPRSAAGQRLLPRLRSG
jgi:predicted  nucleic acid-binding Zn-ribbon protein